MALPFTLSDQQPKQIGMLVLQADETLERDLRVLMPNELEVLVSRVPSGTELTSETIRDMESKLKGAASLFPCGATLSAVGYGCTSATAQIGAEAVSNLIRQGVDTDVVTEPVSALLAACYHLNLHRLGIISPYIAEVSAQLGRVLEKSGIEVARLETFDEAEEAKVARISKASLIEAAVAVGQDANCDAIFLSCTNLRTLDIIATIEDRIGKPVLSSNLVLSWDILRLTKTAPPQTVSGCLFKDKPTG